MSDAKPFAPALSTAARVTLKVTPSTAAAASTFGQVVSRVVGFGGSSRAMSAQRRAESVGGVKPPRKAGTKPPRLLTGLPGAGPPGAHFSRGSWGYSRGG